MKIIHVRMARGGCPPLNQDNPPSKPIVQNKTTPTSTAPAGKYSLLTTAVKVSTGCPPSFHHHTRISSVCIRKNAEDGQRAGEVTNLTA
jgi:hypothetical protein